MIRALVEGILQTWRLRALLFLFWAINLLVATLFIHPYLQAFDEFFINRLVTDVLAHQSIYTYYAEFYYYMNQSVHSALYPLKTGILVQYFVFLLLSGGLITSYFSRKKVRYKQFFLWSLGTMWPMFKTAIFIPFILLSGALLGLLLLLPLALFLPQPFIENGYFYFFVSAGGIWGLFMLLVLLLLDLTRVGVIQYGSASVATEFFRSVRLFLKHPRRFYTLYLLLMLLWILAVVIYWITQQILDDTHLLSLIIQLLVLQLSVFVQIGIRASRFGVLANFVQILEAEPAQLRREVLEAHEMEYDDW